MEMPPTTPPFGGPDYGSNLEETKSSLGQRLIGTISLKESIYREIVGDEGATGTAALIVVLTSILLGIISMVLSLGQFTAAFADPELQQALAQLGVDPAALAGGGLGIGIAFVVIQVIASLLGWLIWGLLLTFTTNTLFSGSLSYGAALRLGGFTSLFSLLGIVPCGGIAALAISAYANVVGLRSAAFEGPDAGGKAIYSVLVGILIVFLIWIIISVAIIAIFATLIFAIMESIPQ